MREQRQRFALFLAVTVSVGRLERRFREGALPAGHRVQGSADAIPQPFTISERRALAHPLDRPERDYPEPKPERKRNSRADPNADTKVERNALEPYPGT